MPILCFQQHPRFVPSIRDSIRGRLEGFPPPFAGQLRASCGGNFVPQSRLTYLASSVKGVNGGAGPDRVGRGAIPILDTPQNAVLSCLIFVINDLLSIRLTRPHGTNL